MDKIGTGTEDIITLCKEKGLKAPEYHQEEDFRVVIWRKGDPERSRGDPERFRSKPSISRAELAKTLNTSERQVRKAIDSLRGQRIQRKGGDSGEWVIIE